MQQPSILIVDDESMVCDVLSEIIHNAGYETLVARDGYEALEIIQREHIPIVIVDMKLPRIDGIEVLKRTRAIMPNSVVIVITGYATMDSAAEAVKYGAFDYIAKPFSFSEIRSIVEKAVASISFSVKPTITQEDVTCEIVTKDSRMLDILEQLKLIAKGSSNVLIQGESGTGKELVARTIHSYSNRVNGPFVAINCAALPEGILESELFGHEKGAFTGAISRRIGKIELAHGGTLLLDEVSEMSKPFQAKLLRTIQEREVVRVGGNQQIKVDVRIIATTNKNIIEEVEAGRFREDLFYRLCVIPVFLPPLRERKDDIPVLAHYFAQRVSARLGKEVSDIPEEVMEALNNHKWPGNIRELENVIERAVALSSDGRITLPNIFFNEGSRKPSKYIALKPGMTLKDIEREIILRALEDVGGNKEKAAKILGITAKTIRNRLCELKKIG